MPTTAVSTSPVPAQAILLGCTPPAVPSYVITGDTEHAIVFMAMLNVQESLAAASPCTT